MGLKRLWIVGLITVMLIPIVFSMNGEITNGDKKWDVLKHSGEESVWIVSFGDLKDKKTDICLTLKDGINVGDVSTLPKSLYDENGFLILDNKAKPITLKYETAKCDGKDGYHISLTDAAAFNTDEYIKIGSNSIIIVYQNSKQVIFSIDDKHNISSTLYWDVYGDGSDWSNSINDLFVYFNESKWKFGAYHNNSEGWERYKYVLESNQMYIKENNIFKYDDYELNLDDICNKIEGNNSADCEFNTYTKNGMYYLEIMFNSDNVIDPIFQEEENVTDDGYLPRDERTSCNGNKCRQSSIHENMLTENGYEDCDELISYDVNGSEFMLRISDDNITLNYYYDTNVLPFFEIKQSGCNFHFFQNIIDDDVQVDNLTFEIPSGFWFENNQITNGNIKIDFTKAVELQGISISDYDDRIVLTGENITRLDPDTGAVSAGEGTSVARSGSSFPWSNPMYIKVSDGFYATTGYLDLEYTYYLRATNFSFTIPTGATIDGINAFVERQGYAGDIEDYGLQLVKNDVLVGTDKSSGVGWTSYDYTREYPVVHSEVELWGATWTPEEVNNDNFGFALSAREVDETYAYPKVDWMGMRIYYTEAAEGCSVLSCGEYLGVSKQGCWILEQDCVGSVLALPKTSNIDIDCQGHSTTGTNTFGFSADITNSKNITVRNCHFIGYGTSAIYTAWGVEVKVENCNFTNDGTKPSYTIYNRGQTYVYNSIFNTSSYAIRNYNAQNITAINNTFESFATSGSLIYFYATNKGVIQNNIFIKNTAYGNKYISSAPNYWSLNTPKTSGTNIVGGLYLGGNYYSTKNNVGYSQTCTDADKDGICDSAYSDTMIGYMVDYYPLTLVDEVNPTVWMYRPKNGSYLNGENTMKVIASDNIGVKNVEFYLSNVTLGQAHNWTLYCNDTTEPYTCPFNTDDLANSTLGYVADAIIFDVNNNHANTTLDNYFFIDRDAPKSQNVSITYPNDQTSVKNGQYIVAKINVTDGSGSGINLTWMNLTYLNGTSSEAIMNMESGGKDFGEWNYWNLSIKINTTTGNQEALFVIKDNVVPIPNIKDSDIEYVVVDNDNPTYSGMQDSDDTGTVYNGDDVFFKVNAQDNYNLKNCTLSTNISGTWNNISIELNGDSELAYYETIATTGNYTYYWIIYDDAYNSNMTILGNLSVNSGGVPEEDYNIKISLHNPTDGYNSTLRNITFTFNESGLAANCSLYINNSPSYNISSPVENNLYDINLTLSLGEYIWEVYCPHNTSNQTFFSDIYTLRIDDIHPMFSDYNYSPENGTEYSNAGNYSFNVTVTNSNTSVFISWNGVNYSLNNHSNTLYNITFHTLSAGLYTYYYWAYGSGVLNNWNRSVDFNYTVNPGCAENMIWGNYTFNFTSGCYINDTINNSYYKVYYDEYQCGDTLNSTIEYYIFNESCNYCEYDVITSNYTFNFTSGCWKNDTINNSYFKTEYDRNKSDCYDVTGLASDLWNDGEDKTVEYYIFNETCDYCSYDLANSTTFFNDTLSCSILDLNNDSYYVNEYDQNFSSCYMITGLPTDLYNDGVNNTYESFVQNITCNYCSYSTNYTDYTFNETIGCWKNDTINNTYYITTYDGNRSTCYDITGIESDQLLNSSVEYFIFNETCNYCGYQVAFTNLTYNYTVECNINDTNNDTYYAIEYDENKSFCYDITLLPTDLWNDGLNNTYEYNIFNESCDACTPSMTTTDYVYNYTVGCYLNDTNEKMYYKLTYDLNDCGEQANYTIEYTLYDEACNYCSYSTNYTDYTFNYTYGCYLNDSVKDAYYKITYDGNQSDCYDITGIVSDYLENSSIEYLIYNKTCNYCSYEPVNTSLIFNTTLECLPSDLNNDSYYKLEYDQNKSTCYDITGIISDLWNNGENNTYTSYYQNVSCTTELVWKWNFRNIIDNSYAMRLREDGLMNVTNIVIQQNIILYSPDGTTWNCGVTDGGILECT